MCWCNPLYLRSDLPQTLRECDMCYIHNFIGNFIWSSDWKLLAVPLPHFHLNVLSIFYFNTKIKCSAKTCYFIFLRTLQRRWRRQQRKKRKQLRPANRKKNVRWTLVRIFVPMMTARCDVNVGMGIGFNLIKKLVKVSQNFALIVCVPIIFMWNHGK